MRRPVPGLMIVTRMILLIPRGGLQSASAHRCRRCVARACRRQIPCIQPQVPAQAGLLKAVSHRRLPARHQLQLRQLCLRQGLKPL